MEKDKTIVRDGKRKTKNRERENWGENSEVQRDNWAVRNKGMERGLQRLCVCVYLCVRVSHERVLFSDKYIVLISMCGDRSVCMLSPSETQSVCERVCVHVTHSEMTESYSILPLRFASQSAFDPPAQHRHTHTSLFYYIFGDSSST